MGIWAPILPEQAGGRKDGSAAAWWCSAPRAVWDVREWEERPSEGRDGASGAAGRWRGSERGEMKGGETKNKYARLRVSKG